jgi:hypothetical protein
VYLNEQVNYNQSVDIVQENYLRPLAAIEPIFLAPYFLRPIAAEIAAAASGDLPDASIDFCKAEKRLPLPGLEVLATFS